MQQTRERLERFLKDIRSLDDLPQPVAEVIRQHHQPVDSIRQMIKVPPGEYPIYRETRFLRLPFGWRKTPERVLVFGSGLFSVIEVTQGAPSAVIVIPLASLIELHSFLLLLYSRLEVTWDDSGSLKTLKIEYNSVGDHMIWRGINALRAAFAALPGPGAAALTRDDLAHFPFKFRTYTLDSLMRGETLVAATYQDAIRAEGGHWHRYLTPNRVIALTDRNIFTLEDQRHHLRYFATKADYTVSRHFFPLDRLRSAQVEPAPEADHLRLVFAVSSATHEVVIPLQPPYARQFCDVLHQKVLAQPAGV